MTDSLSKTPDLFLSNAAARDYGFTDEFWHKVYTLYLEAVQRDPSVSFDKLEVERTSLFSRPGYTYAVSAGEH